MNTPTCRHCGRPRSVCRTPVDGRWPQAARQAFERAGMTDAQTCAGGQAEDLRLTGGWCWDRARFSGDWTGEPPTPAERRGAGLALEGRRP